MAALSKEGLVALVRELLVLEAEQVLTGDRVEDAGDEVYSERVLHVARRLYVEYAKTTRRDLRKLLRQLPTLTSVVSNARFAMTHHRKAPTVPKTTQELLRRYADPHALQLARLRQWAARQLKQVRTVKGTNGDLVRVFVYLTLRDVCEWERRHVTAFGEGEVLLESVEGSFADVRDDNSLALNWTVLPLHEQYV